MTATQGYGGAPAVNDTVKEALDRKAGLASTASAFDSKTRSPHNAAGSKHYQYEDAGSLDKGESNEKF